ncbi:UNVERIFIED_CONTAM: hypothetical protein Scaly_1640800 [Sesamum calycinum]|uniref:Uncharacterized protein n=1 Tax=Sesamum calycinum TaxID=2727403 RepID=A0AAW2PCR0_9LAMI
MHEDKDLKCDTGGICRSSHMPLNFQTSLIAASSLPAAAGAEFLGRKSILLTEKDGVDSEEVIQDSRNYGALKCVEGIENAVLAKQMESLQTILLSVNKTMEEFHGIVSSLEKIVRDSRQLVKAGSSQPTAKQLKQRVGLKPTLADCLDGLRLLEEMHRSEYLLKLSVVSALPALALKPSESGDLVALQQLLIDQPNIPREEVKIQLETSDVKIFLVVPKMKTLLVQHMVHDVQKLGQKFL